MSQYNINPTQQNVPPDVATSYVTDDGMAIPVGNVIKLLGDNSIDFPINGGGLNTFTAASGNILYVSALAHSVGMSTGANNPDTSAYFLNCPTSGGAITINLPNGTIDTGKRFLIGDTSGMAATHNITINGNGKLINGLASVTISTNWGSIELYLCGGPSTQWLII